MKNPPDFVMYVVLVKLPGSDKFDPTWASFPLGKSITGYARKRDADRVCRYWRGMYGKKNAYVQQYGPYS